MKIILCLVLFLVSCASPEKEKYPPFQDARHYETTNSFTVLIVNVSTLEALGIEQFGTPYLRGLYLPLERLIIVPYSNKKDRDGNYLPNFEVLGHELWHHIYGDWHGGNTCTNLWE
jgi:hypothetical protein